MLAAISPEGYAFIVGSLFFVCSVALVLLACAAAVNPRRAQRGEHPSGQITASEVERFRAELDAERDPVKAIGRVPAEDRWAA